MRLTLPAVVCTLLGTASVGCESGSGATTAEQLNHAVSRAGVSTSVAQKVVQAALDHKKKLDPRSTGVWLQRLQAEGFKGEELADAFVLAAEALDGTATAPGTIRYLDLAAPSRPGPTKIREALRRRKEIALAKVPEELVLRCLAEFRALAIPPADAAVFLEGLPIAKAAKAEEEASGLFVRLAKKFRLAPETRGRLYRAALDARGRGVAVGVTLDFAKILNDVKLPEKEILAYIGHLAKAGGSKVDLYTLADNFDALEALPLPAERRLELFRGVVAALAAGTPGESLQKALGALRDARVPPETLDPMVEATLRAFATYSPDSVGKAVERALRPGREPAQIPEALAKELSLAAAGG
ncbi:MAG: hypothetical protein L0216_06020 [Planctomycetales bacterium]|nr:hypothetical protein [Planctomycetales bacterium]